MVQPRQLFIDAVTRYEQGDIRGARQQMTDLHRLHPQESLYRYARDYLRQISQSGPGGLYDQREAFAQFIRGGSNVALYRHTSAALNAIYKVMQPRRLLDIGVGDGLALIAALDGVENVELTVVEPAAALLHEARRRLSAERPDLPLTAVAESIQAYVQTPKLQFELIQATFALHNVPPAQRDAVWRWAAAQKAALLLVEFDVPEVRRHVDYIAHVHDAYWRGVKEYEQQPVVIMGFLMPIMFGNFAPDKKNRVYEQPLDRWAAEIGAAGFAQINVQQLYDYWWAPACLLTATVAPPASTAA